MKHPLYFAYSMIVMLLVSVAEYRGWSLMSVNEVKNVPKSVRDNPGAYRSHYAFYPRHIGGK